jgi:Insertion element 4 transposase N-terminal
MDRIQRLDKQDDFSESVSFEAVSRVQPREMIEEVIAESGAQEERRRKMPAALTLWLCILMNMYSGLGLQAVLVRMVRGTRLVAGAGLAVCAQKSSISKARYRLGVEPLRRLFGRLCQPLAKVNDANGFRYGLRLMAMDSTVEQTADTAANQAIFGRQPGTRDRAGSAFPQVRCVYACKCGTQALIDAQFMPYRTGDIQGARHLLRCIDESLLVMLDAGLFSADLLAAIAKPGSHVLCRVRKTIRPPANSA